jgi:hypothetical protein
MSMLIAAHLLVVVASSTPKQRGNWENWGFGVVAVLGVVAVVYWLTFTEPHGNILRRRRKRRR